MTLPDHIDSLTKMRILSVEEIYWLLRNQADQRAPENDEAGILQDLAEDWIKRLVDLDPHQYGGLNSD